MRAVPFRAGGNMATAAPVGQQCCLIAAAGLLTIGPGLAEPVGVAMMVPINATPRVVWIIAALICTIAVLLIALGH
jgi:hypothetical protein